MIGKSINCTAQLDKIFAPLSSMMTRVRNGWQKWPLVGSSVRTVQEKPLLEGARSIEVGPFLAARRKGSGC